ncbi:MAG: tryptophan synthase subunit alpha [Pirellulales bacterium]|nr:tryptophan synthase subunit alpha [Planctomycetales bacterium]
MSKIDECFAKLRAEGKKAFVPFITAGDPDLATTEALIRELASRGASICEVGIPYSDPIADGPVIQASYTRALDAGVKLADIFAMLKRASAEVDIPLLTMVSYSIVLRHGPQQYVDDAVAAGVSGLIVPDLPVDESSALASICRKADLGLVHLVTPTTPKERAVRIARASTGFLYYVSVAGITGERRELPAELVENVRWLAAQTDVPVCIGFGISTPEHVRQLSPVADGLIVGSAIVRRVGESGAGEATVKAVGEYVAELLAAYA